MSALVVGDTDAARLVCSALAEAGTAVTHLHSPSEDELRASLLAGPSALAVVVRGDIIALRYELLIEHVRPDVTLIVTVFDKTIADQLRAVLPGCEVTSPADIAVPSIVAACLGPGQSVVDFSGGLPCVVAFDGTTAVVTAWSRAHRSRGLSVSSALRRVRGHDTTSKVMLCGAFGLALVLAVDWTLVTFLRHEPPDRALYNAVRVVATVGPGDTEGHTLHWYLLLSSALMVLTIGFMALLTAGLVNRLLSTRSVAIVGRRVMPTRDHVIVIGLGQVGLRLCIQLRRLGVPIVAVERDPAAANLRLAKGFDIPVVIAHAEDRATLKRVSVDRARALAAMGSDELDNVEAAIAALAVAPALRIVLRAGSDDVIAETTSLFHIGEVRDVAALTACAVTRSMLGLPAGAIVQRGEAFHAIDLAGGGRVLDGLRFVSMRPCKHPEGGRAESEREPGQ